MVAELVTRALTPHYYLPDVVRNWPWPRNLNPFYADCKAESDAWCESFGAFSPKGQIAFNSFNFSTSRPTCNHSLMDRLFSRSPSFIGVPST